MDLLSSISEASWFSTAVIQKGHTGWKTRSLYISLEGFRCHVISLQGILAVMLAVGVEL